MSDFVSFTPAEIEKIGLVCKHCGTEVVIALKDAELETPRRCPSCMQKDRSVAIQPIEPPFAYQTNWNWLTQVRQLAGSEQAGLVRFYFKERE